jgi:hypothetical protein
MKRGAAFPDRIRFGEERREIILTPMASGLGILQSSVFSQTRSTP